MCEVHSQHCATSTTILFQNFLLWRQWTDTKLYQPELEGDIYHQGLGPGMA